MKKKILIVNKSFAVGGIQTSLINMLKEIKDDYEIDLLVFYNEGPFKEKVPEDINVIKPSLLVSALGMSMADLKKCKNPITITFRLFAAFWTKLFSNSLPITLALISQKRLTGYDVAIAYHHETKEKTVVSGFSRFILKCVDARKKVTWMHADSIKAGLNTSQIRKTYSQIDNIICVSKSAMQSLITCFPELEDKCDLCYNFHPYNDIIHKSEEKYIVFDRNHDELLLFTACRFSKEKGLVRSIRAIAELVKKGHHLKWYIAGDGIEKENILKEIEKYSLHNTIILLGMVSNPYPYMKEADIVFICSFHEAAPMVVDESKIVGTPIFSTDIPVIREKVGSEYGFICENSEEGIYLGLKNILDNPKIVRNAREYLVGQTYTNEDSVKRFNAIINVNL